MEELRLVRFCLTSAFSGAAWGDGTVFLAAGLNAAEDILLERMCGTGKPMPAGLHPFSQLGPPVLLRGTLRRVADGLNPETCRFVCTSAMAGDGSRLRKGGEWGGCGHGKFWFGTARGNGTVFLAAGLNAAADILLERMCGTGKPMPAGLHPFSQLGPPVLLRGTLRRVADGLNPETCRFVCTSAMAGDGSRLRKGGEWGGCRQGKFWHTNATFLDLSCASKTDRSAAGLKRVL